MFWYVCTNLLFYYFMYKIIDIFLYFYKLDIIAETRCAVLLLNWLLRCAELEVNIPPFLLD